MKKKLLALSLAMISALSLTACGGESAPADSGSDAAGDTYTVGICQFTQHPALDAATQGFQDAINEALPGQVTFDLQNASNDIPTCGVISTGFVANGVGPTPHGVGGLKIEHVAACADGQSSHPARSGWIEKYIVPLT